MVTVKVKQKGPEGGLPDLSEVNLGKGKGSPRSDSLILSRRIFISRSVAEFFMGF